MSGKCEKCLQNITKGRFPGVKCGMCVSLYHIKCVGLNEEMINDLKLGSATWVCPDCRSSSNSSIIDGDYVDNGALTGMDIPNINDVISILKGMQNKLDALTASLNFVCQSLDEMKSKLTNLTKNYNDLDTKIAVLEKKFEANEEKVNVLEARLDLTNQERNKCNIVVCGIPSNGNDIPNIITKLFDIIGIQIANDDVISTKEMVHNKQTVSLLKNSFIVTLKSAVLKNNSLMAFRKKKTIFAKDLSADFSTVLQNQRVFVLDHLTKFQSRLYSAAKNIKNNHKFQFLWCKDNSIYLRKAADSQVFHISSFNDINRINCLMQPPTTSDIKSPSAQRNDVTSFIATGS